MGEFVTDVGVIFVTKLYIQTTNYIMWTVAMVTYILFFLSELLY